uniref:C1q domain-containing protein n=1 Tax=viral metagenome TaxID=1070528 RepID=A0A6M3IS65_9ZZZZ
MNKKTIVSLVIAFLAVPLIAFGYTTLFDFYQGSLPSIQERAKIYSAISSDKYTGTYLQNNALLKYLQGNYPSEDYLVVLTDPFSNQEIDNPYSTFGADSGQRPSNFKTTLSRSLTSSASTTETIYVSSLTTKDSHTLTTADVGDFIAFHINPGSSNDEIVVCTAVGTLSFTNCTRGYGFYTNAAVTGNAKSHSPGETVVISNDDVWLKTQYTANDDDETIYGKWTYASSTLTTPYFRIGNTTYGDIGYNGTLNQLEYRNNAGSWTAIGGGALTYTGSGGIDVTSNIISPSFYSLGGLRSVGNTLAIATSTDLVILGDGLVYMATTTSKTISGKWTFTNGITGYASSTIASTTMYTLNVGNIFATTTPQITHSEGVRAYRTSALTLTTNPATYNLISWDTEDFDLANEHSGGTFTVASTGYYTIHSQIKIITDNSPTSLDLIIFKNGIGIATSSSWNSAPNVPSVSIFDNILLNAGDTIKVYASSSPTGAVVNLKTGSGYSWLNIFKR